MKLAILGIIALAIYTAGLWALCKYINNEYKRISNEIDFENEIADAQDLDDLIDVLDAKIAENADNKDKIIFCDESTFQRIGFLFKNGKYRHHALARGTNFKPNQFYIMEPLKQ
jgi:hypothetical protein